MSINEQAIVFPCSGEQLLGIIATPELPGKIGVLIIVGGPQYRAGSHRQFLLLSRALAAAGYSVMRFDYRGMGDSSGDLRNFKAVDEDIGTAIDVFCAHCTQLERIVLWGLCDAASASLLYWDTTRDSRIVGLVLLNPWVRSEATLARAYVKHYYGQRLVQPEFWRKLLTGRLRIGRALGGFIGSLRQARQQDPSTKKVQVMSFQQRMLRGLQEFPGVSTIILSGNDYTAKEFLESANASVAWQEILKQENVSMTEIPAADHTFSSAEWRSGVERLTIGWMKRVSGR
jgi:exosortase A-associated hydrolase 1